MREIREGDQLALGWTDELRWDQLPVAMQAELRAVLRALLQRAGRTSDAQGEAAHDE
jgi:hypothetical protein